MPPAVCGRVAVRAFLPRCAHSWVLCAHCAEKGVVEAAEVAAAAAVCGQLGCRRRGEVHPARRAADSADDSLGCEGEGWRWGVVGCESAGGQKPQAADRAHTAPRGIRTYADTHISNLSCAVLVSRVSGGRACGRLRGGVSAAPTVHVVVVLVVVATVASPLGGG